MGIDRDQAVKMIASFQRALRDIPQGHASFVLRTEGGGNTVPVEGSKIGVVGGPKGCGFVRLVPGLESGHVTLTPDNIGPVDLTQRYAGGGQKVYSALVEPRVKLDSPRDGKVRTFVDGGMFCVSVGKFTHAGHTDPDVVLRVRVEDADKIRIINGQVNTQTECSFGFVERGDLLVETRDRLIVERSERNTIGQAVVRSYEHPMWRGSEQSVMGRLQMLTTLATRSHTVHAVNPRLAVRVPNSLVQGTEEWWSQLASVLGPQEIEEASRQVDGGDWLIPAPLVDLTRVALSALVWDISHVPDELRTGSGVTFTASQVNLGLVKWGNLYYRFYGSDVEVTNKPQVLIS